MRRLHSDLTAEKVLVHALRFELAELTLGWVGVLDRGSRLGGALGTLTLRNVLLARRDTFPRFIVEGCFQVVLLGLLLSHLIFSVLKSTWETSECIYY